MTARLRLVHPIPAEELKRTFDDRDEHPARHMDADTIDAPTWPMIIAYGLTMIGIAAFTFIQIGKL